MIPILYESTETAFASNGIGRLTECNSCKVTEVRNGEYECEFSYPITGRLYNKITEGKIISCTHSDRGDRQPFIIYRRSTPDLNGVVKFNAHHYTYLLNQVIMPPFTASSASDAFAQFETDTINANPFLFWTNNTTGGTAKSEIPIAVRAALGGTEGSVLDAFHGEYEWDVKTVRLHAQRGVNSGITIRYGKNLASLSQTKDELGVYNAAVGYWLGDVNDTQVLVTTGIVSATGVTNPVPVVLDMSGEFETQPEVADLAAKVRTYLDSKTPWMPKENYKINFVQLWQTEEFKEVAALQRLSLCDRVNVYYPLLGVEVNDVEVIKVVYNVLLDRYDEMELGQPTSSLAQTLIQPYQDEIQRAMRDAVTKSTMQAAIAAATEAITGGGGGVFRWKFNADNQPIELAILDTGNIDTAINVWRWNDAGLGHSSNGYGGIYDLAILANGAINAAAITVGYLSATRIKGGTLTLGGADNGNGVLVVKDDQDNEIGRWDNTGAQFTGNITLYNEDVSADINEVDGFFFRFAGVSGKYIRKVKAHALRITGDSWGDLASSRYRANASVFVANDMFQMYKESAKTALELFVAYQADRAIITKSDTGKYHFLNEYTGPDGYIAANIAVTTNTDIGYSERSYTEGRGQLFLLLKNYIALCSEGFYTGQSSSSRGYIGTDQGLQADYRSSYFYISPDYGGIVANCGDGTNTSKASLYILGIFDLRANAKMTIHDNAIISITDRFNVSYNTIQVSNGTQSKYVQFQSSSSRRYKHDIKDIEDKKLNPHRLYDLPVRQFEYNDDATLQYADMEGQTLPGFIAEEVAAVYPSAVIRDQEGHIESWDERRILPGVLALVQEQKKKIDSLEARIEKLESLVNSMIGD